MSIAVAWSPIYAHPLPKSHRFPMEKYELLPEQLIYERTISKEQFFVPFSVNEKQILAVHEKNYWNRLKTLQLNKAEIRRSGFPLSQQLVDRELLITGGTIDCAKHALQHGCALNIAGGTHHAGPDFAEGFCLLNDAAVAAQCLLDQGLVQKILIVDLDVHQGNGTALIFQNEKRVFTFSMHCAKNFPARKERSDLDIGLRDSCEDKEYLNVLATHLPKIIAEERPEIVFYQAGVDVLESDKLGRLSMSIDGCKERDRFVLQSCLDADIPIAITMGGGYSTKIRSIVEAHANTFRLASSIYF